MVEKFSTGNEEIDRQFGDSIPIPTLMLIEGGHGTGKSAMVALFMHGLLESGKKVLFIT
ncbi:MAG: flagellar accessory protein FlaH, partial [Thaumarchaeota archaeon]|nr:flagellar accessory protein FlaH [Nitrososphaerota archaeon]